MPRKAGRSPWCATSSTTASCSESPLGVPRFTASSSSSLLPPLPCTRASRGFFALSGWSDALPLQAGMTHCPMSSNHLCSCSAALQYCAPVLHSSLCCIAGWGGCPHPCCSRLPLADVLVLLHYCAPTAALIRRNVCPHPHCPSPCIVSQGWLSPPTLLPLRNIYPNKTALGLPIPCPGTKFTLGNISFNSPDQLAAMMQRNE